MFAQNANDFVLQIGGGADFRDENETKINGKLISEEDGRELAQKIGAKMFMECSALTQKNLKEVFMNSIQCALEKKSKQTKNSRKRRHAKCLLL